MKNYRVVFSERGRSDFLRLLEERRSSACIIASWLDQYLEGCKNPRTRGRVLRGDLRWWRYKVGKYRILAEIEKDTITVLAVLYG